MPARGVRVADDALDLRQGADMQRILALIIVSAVIFEGDPAAVVPMAFAVTLATLIAVPRSPGRLAIRPLRLLRFLPYFLLVSAQGGMDVAMRAFRGRRALRPGFIEHRSALTGELPIVFANIVSLLPGTLTARVNEGVLTVHVLDTTAPVGERLRELEGRVARAFGAAP